MFEVSWIQQIVVGYIYGENWELVKKTKYSLSAEYKWKSKNSLSLIFIQCAIFEDFEQMMEEVEV